MSKRLSNRALRFLDSSVRMDPLGGVIRREMVAVDASLVEAGSDINKAISSMVLYGERYGGRVISVKGGALAGSLVLGCGAKPVLRRSVSGELMFRIASHDSAQCAIVMSESGQVGCSWSTEFHPLFDSIEHFIEDCAAWFQIRGWQYVAISDFKSSSVVAALGNIPPDEIASGEIAKWWIGTGVAIVSHPYLNPGRGSSMQVAVLAASALESERVEQMLKAKGIGDQGTKAASLWRIVP